MFPVSRNGTGYGPHCEHRGRPCCASARCRWTTEKAAGIILTAPCIKLPAGSGTTRLAMIRPVRDGAHPGAAPSVAH